MNQALMFLLNLLEEEFRGCDRVRIVPVPPSTTARSPDLVQDYDPEGSQVHRQSGVMVRTLRKEFFFPEEWFFESGRTSIHRQIFEIREHLG